MIILLEQKYANLYIASSYKLFLCKFVQNFKL